jgi:hypothetical protein
MEYIVIFLISYIIFRIIAIRNERRFEFEHRIKPAPNIIKVKQEIIDDAIYFWNEDTDEFLAQGIDFETAAKNLTLNYPNTKFLIKE